MVGDLNDTFSSAALREIMGSRQQFVRDVRPADEVGDVWTYFTPGEDEYARIDFLLASEGLWPEVVKDRTRVARHPLNLLASDHRPLVGVFRARECAPTGESSASTVSGNEPADTVRDADDSNGSALPEPGPPP